MNKSRSWFTMSIHADQTTQSLFKASVQCVLGDGRSILFWSDPWLDGVSIVDSSVPPTQTEGHGLEAKSSRRRRHLTLSAVCSTIFCRCLLDVRRFRRSGVQRWEARERGLSGMIGDNVGYKKDEWA
jgi:hypothetical protein